MLKVFPDYYSGFKCISSDCKHNCCIGWKITVDDNTLEKYKKVQGALGKRLKNRIKIKNKAYFKLRKGKRCPFLNKDNLCELIINLGEDNLCDICTLHPRFRNFFTDRVETGLGLCCERAGQIILGKKEIVTFIKDGKIDNADPIIELRDKCISILQDRTKPLNKRVQDFLSITNGNEITDYKHFLTFIYKLERISSKWGKLIKGVKKHFSSIDNDSINNLINEYESELEQFLVYLVYRHLANANDQSDIVITSSLIVFLYRLLLYLCAYVKVKNNKFDFNDLVEICRLVSSEIEYSDDNFNALLEEISFEIV